MNLKDTTLADVMSFMYKNETGVVNVDFEIKGMKASLEIALVSREEENQWTNANAKN